MNGTSVGNVGTNAGAISGFASTVTTASAIAGKTDNAATEVSALFTGLSNANPTNTTPMALELGGLPAALTAGVYAIPGAASITGTLTFDGGSTRDASTKVFVIQVAGAMATAANAQVVLTGGALASNIYWQVNGAVALGAGTQLAGNIVGGAAIAIGAGSSINGNVYTIGGAIALGSSTVYNTSIPVPTAYVPVVPSDLMAFQIYTGAGAITDAATSSFKQSGLVGTGAGAITGIPAANIGSSSTVAGEIATLFTALSNATPTPTTATPMALELGGQKLTAGVYAIPGAASLTGALTLDAQNNPNAIFIFQVTGAMATAASATVVLGNGALAKNIFWQIDGAVALGAGTNFDGTIVSGAAIAIGANCTVQGDVYTTGGAITISGTSFTNNNITRSTTSLMNINGLVNTSENLSIYPNPNHGKINVLYNGDKTQVVATQVYDANMHLVYTNPGFKASIELPSAQAGVNFIYLQLKTKTLTHKFVLLKN